MVIDNNAQTLYGIPLVLISEEYNRLLAQYNVRTHTVLSRLREEVSSDREFFRLLLLLSDLDIYHLPQCGRQTSVFIKELLDSLHSYVGIPYASSGDNHRDKGLLYLSSDGEILEVMRLPHGNNILDYIKMDDMLDKVLEFDKYLY